MAHAHSVSVVAFLVQGWLAAGLIIDGRTRETQQASPAGSPLLQLEDASDQPLNLQMPNAQSFLDFSQLPGSPQMSFAQSPLGLPPQPPASPQIPYGQSLIGSSFFQQQLAPNPALYGPPASLQSFVLALQAELATEHRNELQLAGLAAEKEQELLRMNQNFTHMSMLAETGAEQDRRLHEQLANATAMNDVLHKELAKVRDRRAEELSDDQAQVSTLQEKLQIAEQQAKQSEVVRSRALRIMKDVQVAQEKVQRTEDIIRNLVPSLLPHHSSLASA